MLYFFVILRLIFLFLLFFILFKPKKALLFYVFSVFFLLLSISILFINYTLDIYIFGYKFNLLPALYICLFAVLLFPAVKHKEILFFVLLPLGIDWIVKLSLSLLLNIPFYDLNASGYYYFTWYQLLLEFLLYGGVFLFYLFIKSRKKTDYQLLFLLSILLLLIEIACFFAINYQIVYNVIHNQKSYTSLILFNIIFFICLLISLASFVILYVRTKKKNEAIASYQEELLHNHYQNVYLAHQEELFKLKHDMANIIQAIPETDIKNELTLKLNEAPKIFYTKHKLINSILVFKRNIAIQRGILPQFDIAVSEYPSIQKTETISLLSNILDNAIEACQKTEEKKLVFTLSTTSTLFELTCKNSMIDYQEKTKKPDAMHHGFGSKIIKQIVHKYKGIYHIETHSNEFSIYIRIEINK